MRILLTNDDGIYAEGLRALAQALGCLGQVMIVAPDRPQSGVGHGITLHKPLRVARVTLPDGGTAYAVNGTPPDCVLLGLRELAPDVSLVVSGINHGTNLGEDVIYSGTVAGAREGSLNDVLSLAISAEAWSGQHLSDAAHIACQVARQMLAWSIPREVFLNVNVPARPLAEIAGFRCVRQARRRYRSSFEQRVDPRGRVYYWLGDGNPQDLPAPGTDVAALQEGYVTVMPTHSDLTAYAYLDEWKDWVEKWRMET